MYGLQPEKHKIEKTHIEYKIRKVAGEAKVKLYFAKMKEVFLKKIIKKQKIENFDYMV